MQLGKVVPIKSGSGSILGVAESSKKMGLIIGNNQALSHQEVLVLKGLLLGQTFKVIARSMGISRHTVETYVLRIKQKLNCRSKVEIISFCFALGINGLVECYDDFL